MTGRLISKNFCLGRIEQMVIKAGITDSRACLNG